MKKQQIKAFTLIEIIVVITILAILATIWFMSYQSYTSDARDANRITSFWEIKNWLNIYKLKNRKFPSPDGSVLSWTINWTALVYVWELWDTISKKLNLTFNPTDPLTKTNYVYGTTKDYKYYQISSIMENTIWYENNITNQTYAWNEEAKVEWNYKWILKYSSWSEKWITNVPSLIFNNTGSVDLLNSGTYFVVNKKTNLPYNFSWIKDSSIRKVDWTSLIRDITKSTNSTLTWVNITNLTTDNFSIIFTWATLNSFNVSWVSTWTLAYSVKADIMWVKAADTPTYYPCTLSWQTILHLWSITAFTTSVLPYGSSCNWITRTCNNWLLSWSDTYLYPTCTVTAWANCTASTYSWITINPINHSLSQNFSKTITYWTWDVTAICTNAVLSYWSINTTCSTNYVPSWTWNCVLDTCSWILPANSQLNWTQWTATWGYSTTAWLCKFVCQAGYYWNWASCLPASAGYYVASAWSASQTACTTWQYQNLTTQTTYKACTNKPANSSYTASTWLTTNTCPWSCNAGFHTEDSLTCISNTQVITIPNWSCSQTWNWSSRWACNVGSCTNWATWDSINWCNAFSLDANWVTVKCAGATLWSTWVVNWKTYIAVWNGTLVNWIKNTGITDYTSLCTSNVTDMSSLFQSKTTFNQDISSWDTSKVTNMSSMFSSATSFNQNISSWNLSSLVSVNGYDLWATSWLNSNKLKKTWNCIWLPSNRYYYWNQTSYSVSNSSVWWIEIYYWYINPLNAIYTSLSSPTINTCQFKCNTWYHFYNWQCILDSDPNWTTWLASRSSYPNITESLPKEAPYWFCWANAVVVPLNNKSCWWYSCWYSWNRDKLICWKLWYSITCIWTPRTDLFTLLDNHSLIPFTWRTFFSWYCQSNWWCLTSQNSWVRTTITSRNLSSWTARLTDYQHWVMWVACWK